MLKRYLVWGILSFIFSSYAFADKQAIIQIQHAYINSMPPGVNITAGFFELKNTGNKAITLIAVSSPAIKDISIHNTSHVNGRMKMQKVDHLTLAAGETIKFKHGGFHLMMQGFSLPLIPGNTLSLTLHFTRSSDISIQADIRDIRKKNSQHHTH